MFYNKFGHIVVPPMPPIKQWKTETQIMLISEL